MRKIVCFLIIICLLSCSCSGGQSNITEEEYTKITNELSSVKSNLEESKEKTLQLTEENTKLKKEFEEKKNECDKLTEANNALKNDMSEEKKLYDGIEDKYEELKNTYDTLLTEYSEYKEKMQPYEELGVKEAEARKIEAEKKIQEEEEKKKKAEEEERKKKDEEEKKGYNTGITYKQLARTPDDYIGQKIKFSGKVVQVVDGSSEVHIRLAVNNNYDSILYCAYDPSILSFRILEDDKIIVYGTSLGLYSYTSTMGATITIPSAWIDKIELKS